MPVTKGQNLAHYGLLEKIGKGGMDVVWRATGTKLDREVALELPPVELAGNAERQTRDFMSETPVSDEVFTLFADQFEWDPIPLDAAIEDEVELADGVRQKATSNAAHGGLSRGAMPGAIIPAIEDRIRVHLLWVAGLGFQMPQPEVNATNLHRTGHAADAAAQRRARLLPPGRDVAAADVRAVGHAGRAQEMARLTRRPLRAARRHDPRGAGLARPLPRPGGIFMTIQSSTTKTITTL